MEWFVLVLSVAAVLVAARSVDVRQPFSLQDWAPEPTSWQKWIFVLWTMAGPLYLLCDWYAHGTTLVPPELTRFQHRQKLIGDLWTAGAVMLGVLWGIKKLTTLK
jgi:hypothetical protein